MPHTDRFYDNELNHLAELLNSQGRLVQESIRLAEKALHEPSKSLITEAKLKDEEINKLTGEIDDAAVSIIALRQPVAIDLRFLIAAIKITSLFERIGDKAKATVRRSLVIEPSLLRSIEPKITEMGNKSLTMIDQLIDSLATYDIEGLYILSKTEEDLDAYYRELTASLLTTNIQSPESLDSLYGALAICKNFEKIGDIAIKIARIIYFIEEGERTNKL